VAVDVICVIAAAALMLFTFKLCRASRVPYLLGVPAGFGLLAVAFALEALTALALPNIPNLGQSLLLAFLLTQTYAFLFLAFTYARRTRLPLIGQSNVAVIASGAVLTIVLVGTIFAAGFPTASDTVPVDSQLLARAVMIFAILYLVYETGRNWSLTRKASEGFICIAYVFFLFEQIGFVLALANFGEAATFLGYEGRVLGLLILNAILYVGVRPGDFITALKRIGLEAPAH
jgi:hypothetical protein